MSKPTAAVVNITTKGFQGERFLLIEVPSEGEGSGVVIDRQGHILTNFHVVDGARQIQVTLFDGNTYDARLVGQDPATDVAVLKIEAPPATLFPVVFGNSTQLKVGQRVFAIGNPFGLERTLTTGHHRQFEPLVAQPPLGPLAEVDHPDRCGDQSGQFRRPALGQPRADDRHEYGHRQQDGRERRAWALPSP